ncbi:MAG: 4-(cytidine 5'-diphospho)-2-C-methyl-D-erythritol kinase, partial [Paracoccaceae bacterium]
MTERSELARAKINLCLHVTGRRADGYHLLDSLVVFADLGDRVTVKSADRLSLTITGPMAASLPVSDDNLVLRAARLMTRGRGAAITLDKVLPVASGIGGGSADAAATL